MEGAAIVVSILLAFSIDAWWDDLQYRKQVLALLAELEPALAENISLLDQNINYIQGHQALLTRFVESDISEVGQIPTDERFETLHSIWRPATIPNNNILLSERLDTENVRFSEFPEFQNALTEWRASVSELEERQSAKLANESDALIALGRHIDIALIWARFDEDSIPLVSEDLLKSIRADDSTMAVAARKLWLNRVHLRSLQSNRDRSSAVLNHIRAELEPN